MNKKFYLGAILLGAMTLSTGALTSCIDNDEPEGITNLRGAKAELLRAKAAVELAKAETEKQNANWVAALAAIDQAKAKQEEAKAKQEEAKAKQEEAKVAYEQAKSEQQKAEALKRMAEAEQKQAEVEAEIARIKAQLEVDLLDLKKNLLNAQKNYDNLVAEIEAAKAVLTDEQASKLEALQDAVETAWGTYKSKESAVLTAMNNLFTATNTEEDNIEALQKAVVDAKAKLVAINAAYDELKALAEEATPTAWEARMDDLKNYKDKTAALEKAELQLKMDEIKQSAEYKAAEKEDKAALMAYIAAQQNYNYLADGNKHDCFDEADPSTTALYGYETVGTHPTTNERRDPKKYDLQGATIMINNPEAFDKIKAAITSYASSLKEDESGQRQRFEVSGTVGLEYSELFNAFGAAQPLKPSVGNPEIAKTVAAWEDALKKVKVTDEEIDAENCKANYEKAVEDAQKKHDEAVAAWKKAHKTYADGKVEQSVSTDAFKAAIKTYNDNVVALEAAVEAYNNAWDAALTSNINAIFNALNEVYSVKIYIDYLKTDCPNAAVKNYFNDLNNVTNKQWNNAKTVAAVDAIVASCDATATFPTDYSSVAKIQNAAKKYISKQFVIDEAEDVFKAAAKTNAKIGVAKGATISTTLANATFAEAITGVASTKSVTDALAVLDQDVTGKPKGLQQILNGAGFEANTDGTTKSYTGAYATIDRAITDFQALAQANSETRTYKAINAGGPAEIKKYTGAVKSSKLYINGGNKTTPTYGNVADNEWYVTKYELDESDNYQPTDHFVVVRTAVADEKVTAMSEVKFDAVKAASNWKETSQKAFGTDDANARHTELTDALVNWKTKKDENGKTLTNLDPSTLGILHGAQEKLKNHENRQGVNEEIESLKKQVAEAKAAILAQVAGYTAAVNEAYAAIEPAKKEHQAKHNAAYALIADVDAAITAIDGKIAEYNTIAGDLQAILNAYYNTVEFVYTDENGEEQKMSFTGTDKDFSQVKKWLKAELAKYEKDDTVTADSEGKIKDAEAAIALAEKALERGTADDEFDTVAQKKLALEQAQAELEVAKSRYEFALSQLNDYVAAISK